MSAVPKIPDKPSDHSLYIGRAAERRVHDSVRLANVHRRPVYAWIPMRGEIVYRYPRAGVGTPVFTTVWHPIEELPNAYLNQMEAKRVADAARKRFRRDPRNNPIVDKTTLVAVAIK